MHPTIRRLGACTLTGGAAAKPRDVPALDATTLCVHEWNEGEPALVLIHGFGDGAYIWASTLRLLSYPRRTITYDLRGHGDSDWDPSARYSPSSHRRDLERLLTELNITSAVFVGHSLGADIAIRMVAQRPELARGLVIVDGGPNLDDQALQYLYQEFRTQPRRFASIDAYVDALSARFPLADASGLRELAAAALRPTVQGDFELKCDPAIAKDGGSTESESLWTCLDRISCPTLMVRGAISAVLPPHQAEIVTQRLRVCRLVTIPMAGHAIMLDRPRALAAALTSFLASLE